MSLADTSSLTLRHGDRPQHPMHATVSREYSMSSVVSPLGIPRSRSSLSTSMGAPRTWQAVPKQTVQTVARSIYKEATKYGFGPLDIIRLINELMDEVSVARGGTEIRMLKR